MHLAIEDESGDGMDENTESSELECITGPAVTVRVMPETGPSVTVEWAEKPTPGEVVVLAEALARALTPRASAGIVEVKVDDSRLASWLRGAIRRGEPSGMIRAPFTDAQVASLTAHQNSSAAHPYTCGHNSLHPPLIAVTEGWICEECDYTQEWARGGRSSG